MYISLRVIWIIRLTSGSSLMHAEDDVQTAVGFGLYHWLMSLSSICIVENYKTTCQRSLWKETCPSFWSVSWGRIPMPSEREQPMKVLPLATWPSFQPRASLLVFFCTCTLKRSHSIGSSRWFLERYLSTSSLTVMFWEWRIWTLEPEVMHEFNAMGLEQTIKKFACFWVFWVCFWWILL